MPSTSRDAPSARLDVLDGLRGSMAFWVLLGHVFTSTGMPRVPVLASPHYAVDGFMLLSGFLMTWHYVRRASRDPWTSWRTWTGFYVRRFFRISPLYYLLLIPSYLLLHQYAQWIDALPGLHNTAQLKLPVSGQHVLSHLTYVFGVLPAFHASLPIPDWSISLEMQFYLVFPFLMLVVLRFGWPVLCMGSACIWYLANLPSLGLAGAFTQPSPLCLSLIWFVVGMLWAGGYAERSRTHLPSILMGILLSGVSRDPHDIILIAVFAFLLFTGNVPLLGPLAQGGRKLLSNRFAAFLADASYSVYLTHLLILRPVAYLLITRAHLSGTQLGLIVLGITTALSYSLAMLLRPVEQWGISIGRTFAARIATVSPRPVHGAVPVATPIDGHGVL